MPERLDLSSAQLCLQGDCRKRPTDRAKGPYDQQSSLSSVRRRVVQGKWVEISIVMSPNWSRTPFGKAITNTNLKEAPWKVGATSPCSRKIQHRLLYLGTILLLGWDIHLLIGCWWRWDKIPLFPNCGVGNIASLLSMMVLSTNKLWRNEATAVVLYYLYDRAKQECVVEWESHDHHLSSDHHVSNTQQSNQNTGLKETALLTGGTPPGPLGRMRKRAEKLALLSVSLFFPGRSLAFKFSYLPTTKLKTIQRPVGC